ncbi:uncharacterized protein B0H18DRAFT_456180 [Fomitopsis serialis]|uniref:uncharacterized protein n=1 Tax=Fomitopsis serialis TaxID=139415 RepID=UPI0020080425|nr:uncharacterized protein B0H18DRAFT_456180 [Neoantrodia serialis]KAH9923599.1 hypothetical protein B0H18DRAFT_456180 [Neoantrodia serialis]
MRIDRVRRAAIRRMRNEQQAPVKKLLDFLTALSGLCGASVQTNVASTISVKIPTFWRNGTQLSPTSIHPMQSDLRRGQVWRQWMRVFGMTRSKKRTAMMLILELPARKPSLRLMKIRITGNLDSTATVTWLAGGYLQGFALRQHRVQSTSLLYASQRALTLIANADVRTSLSPDIVLRARHRTMKATTTGGCEPEDRRGKPTSRPAPDPVSGSSMGTTMVSIATDIATNEPGDTRSELAPADAQSPSHQSAPAPGTVAQSLKVVTDEIGATPASQANSIDAGPELTEARPLPLPLPRRRFSLTRPSLTQPHPPPSTSKDAVTQHSPELPRLICKPLSSPVLPRPSTTLLDNEPLPQISLAQPGSQKQEVESTLAFKHSPLVDRATSTVLSVKTKSPLPRSLPSLAPQGPPVVPQPRVSNNGQASPTKRKLVRSEGSECADEQHSREQEPKRAKLAPDGMKMSIQASNIAVDPPHYKADAQIVQVRVPDYQVGGSTHSRKPEVVPPAPSTDHSSHRIAPLKDNLPPKNSQIYSDVGMATSPSGTRSMSLVQQSVGVPERQASCDVASKTARTGVPVPSPSPLPKKPNSSEGESDGLTPSGLVRATAAMSLVVKGDGVNGLADPHQASAGDSHLAQTTPSSQFPTAIAGVDPDVARYIQSLGWDPEVYASKLECIGLKNGAMINATRNLVSESRKDKLEEDLQRLAGLTVVESMILVSGLRRQGDS